MRRCWRAGASQASFLGPEISRTPTPTTNGFRSIPSAADRRCSAAFCKIFLEPKSVRAVQVRMPAASVENPPMNQAEHRAAFFRQSGWLMVANVAGGVFMWAVHFLNKFVHTGEYGSFGALLAVAMLLPTLPLQMIVAQQTAKLLATGAE